MYNSLILKTCNNRVVLDVLTFLYEEERKTKERPVFHVRDLAKKAKLPYPPSSETNLLAGLGLVTKEAKGRPRFIKLTDKGFKFIQYFLEFSKKVNELPL